jgi:hypothetical protein
MSADFINRKNELEKRLKSYGINEFQITNQQYFDFDENVFVSSLNAGRRMLILNAMSYVATETEDRPIIIEWLKEENLWNFMSLKEKSFIEGKRTNKKEIIEYSWQIENSYILAWALNLIKETPTSYSQLSEEQLEDFIEIIPSLGENVADFLQNLEFRNKTEIYDENLFHEQVTTYFRNILFNGKKDTSTIDSNVSFSRHYTLNWLRNYMGRVDWDATDTST